MGRDYNVENQTIITWIKDKLNVTQPLYNWTISYADMWKLKINQMWLNNTDQSTKLLKVFKKIPPRNLQ